MKTKSTLTKLAAIGTLAFLWQTTCSVSLPNDATLYVDGFSLFRNLDDDVVDEFFDELEDYRDDRDDRHHHDDFFFDVYYDDCGYCW